MKSFHMFTGQSCCTKKSYINKKQNKTKKHTIDNIPLNKLANVTKDQFSATFVFCWTVMFL